MRVSCQDGGNIQICRFVQPSWIVREQQYSVARPADDALTGEHAAVYTGAPLSWR